MTIGRVEVWVCSPTKLKKLKKNKAKAEQETAQPTAARFNNQNICTGKFKQTSQIARPFISESNLNIIPRKNVLTEHYCIYSNKRRGAYLIFRATSAALI